MSETRRLAMRAVRRTRARAVPRAAAAGDGARPRHAARRAGALHAARLAARPAAPAAPPRPTCRRCRRRPSRVVQSAAYQALSIDSRSEETLPFRRWAMICQAVPAITDDAAEATLQARLGRGRRRRHDRGREIAPRRGRAVGERGRAATALRRLDVLRRAGEFAAVEALAAKLVSGGLSQPHAAVVAFQRQRIAARDVGRHLLSSALPASEHGPHATQVMQPLPTFWHRLFGD